MPMLQPVQWQKRCSDLSELWLPLGGNRRRWKGVCVCLCVCMHTHLCMQGKRHRLYGILCPKYEALCIDELESRVTEP